MPKQNKIPQSEIRYGDYCIFSGLFGSNLQIQQKIKRWQSGAVTCHSSLYIRVFMFLPTAIFFFVQRLMLIYLGTTDLLVEIFEMGILGQDKFLLLKWGAAVLMFKVM